LTSLFIELVIANSFATQWTVLSKETTEEWQRLSQLKILTGQMNSDQKENLQTAENYLAVVVYALWKVKTAEGIESGTIKSKLDEATDLLAPLRILLRFDASDEAKSLEKRHTRFSMLSRARSSAMPSATVAAEGVPEDDTARVDFYKRLIINHDRKIALLAFLIALLTGLKTHYLGQAFGTLRDYVDLLVLGIGSRVSLDLISAALERFSKRS
jgi:hypothetical protein